MKMHRFLCSSKAVCLLAVVLACRGASAQEEFEGWHLEPGVVQAHLVMVARVVSVSRVTVVEGAKTDISLREFRFQPVRLLKGIFQRDELSMTASDLGITADEAAVAPPLKEGEFRLLILVQPQGLTSFGCVSAAPGAKTFDERVPLLTGPDDPLVAVAETLIKVVDSRSRKERASLLLDRLAELGRPEASNDLAIVPLLSSLRLRADWAARDHRAYEGWKPALGYAPFTGRLTLFLASESTPIRSGAVALIRDMLATGIAPEQPRHRKEIAESLRVVLESDEPNTQVRLATLEALGLSLRLIDDSDLDKTRELLIEQLTAAETYAERAAAATALSHIDHPVAASAVLKALEELPLDEPSEREAAYAQAAVRLDAAGAERVLLARLERTLSARQSLASEVETLGQLRSEESLNLLLRAAGRLNPLRGEREQIATALGRLGDDRTVPILIKWLRDSSSGVKQQALSALEILDSDLAAREVRPLLATEPNLSVKLRIARLLARHGFDDGYALATEHLADEKHTDAASLVLAALDDPRTSDDLSGMLSVGEGSSWRAAAVTGLAAVGHETARQQLLDILTDDRHPLTADAARAAGLTTDAELLPPLATLVQSRNREIAQAALLALRRFFSDVHSSPRGLAAALPEATEADDGERPQPAADVPAQTRTALAASVASLATDAYVEDSMRLQAFAVARLLRGDGYAELLPELADDGELEGTRLLVEVNAERRRMQELAEEP